MSSPEVKKNLRTEFIIITVADVVLTVIIDTLVKKFYV